jgi:RsiW-degrading membrane proteinase PrsW (M82 family)
VEEISPPSSPTVGNVFGFIGGIVGLVILLSAFACGPLLLLSFTVQGIPYPDALGEIVGPLFLLIAAGAIFALEGWRLWRGGDPRIFRPRRVWLLWGLFLILLLVGLLLSLAEYLPSFVSRLPPLLLAFISVTIMFLLPLLILVTVGRLMRGRGGKVRDVLAGLLSGSTIGTGLAMVIEIGIVVVLVILAVALNLLPFDFSDVESLREQMDQPGLMENPEELLSFVTPGLFALIFFFIAIITPLVEEAVKSLGIGIASIWVRPDPARAFLLGVASGAGFAMVENILNSAITGPLWTVGVFSRLAATLMHCATGGLMGWGWGQLWTERRWTRWLLAALGAFALHGAWNGLVVGAVGGGLMAGTRPDDMVWVIGGGMAALILMGLLLLLALGVLGGLVWASRRLGREEEP